MKTLTLKALLAIHRGTTFIHKPTGKRWRLNGKIKTWITRPDAFRAPVKHGLYAYGYMDEYNISEFELEYGKDRFQ